VYLDPASGQPAYVDPTSGQPAGYAGYAGYPAQSPYSPAPGYAFPAYAPPVMVPSQRTNGLSIAAMVVSIVGLLSALCYGVPAIAIGLVGAILGHVGYRQTKERGESGGGMAIAGIAVGWIGVLVGVIVLAVYVYFFIWFKNSVDNYQYPNPAYT
jgi:hypothetical protein